MYVFPLGAFEHPSTKFKFGYVDVGVFWLK